MLCDENDNFTIEILSIERLEDLASEGKVRCPSISVAEFPPYSQSVDSRFSFRRTVTGQETSLGLFHHRKYNTP